MTAKQLQRRNQQLERCLRDALQWCWDREGDLSAQDADNDENYEFVTLRQLRRRLLRTARRRPKT